MSVQLPLKIGKFTVVRLLGSGAMGRVYLATDPDIGRKVAIKVLAGSTDQEAIDRFRVEAQAVGKLIHSNIVMLLEFGVHEDAPFLVMEYLRGEDLDRWALADHPLDQQQRVLLGLCRALHYAHSKEVLHRDIKPGNIHVLPNGEPKLMDFGIAKLAGTAMTATGMLVGTPEFMAPELLVNRPASKASDNYAAALVCYYLLTGQRPFKADSVGSCLARVMEGKISPLPMLRPDLPEDLCDLIMTYLQSVPENRPLSIDPLIAMLGRPLGSLAPTDHARQQTGSTTTVSLAATTVTMPAAATRKKWRKTKFGLIALVALVAVTWYFPREFPATVPIQPLITHTTPGSEETSHAAAGGDVPANPVQAPGTDQPTANPTRNTSRADSDHPNAATIRLDEAGQLPARANPSAPGNDARDSKGKKQATASQTNHQRPGGGQGKQATRRTPPNTRRVLKPLASVPDQHRIAVPSASHKTAPASHSEVETAAGSDPASESRSSAAIDKPVSEQPPPARTTAATTPDDIEHAVITSPGPTLTEVTPHRLHRNQMLQLLVSGKNLTSTQTVRVLSGRRPAPGFKIVRFKLLDAHHLQVSLHVAASTRLGRYRLTTSNADQQTSNALSIQVTL